MTCNYDKGSDMDKLIEKQEKMDRYIKWVLVVAALYFFGHMLSAVAQEAPPPVMQCTSNGMGTIICYPI